MHDENIVIYKYSVVGISIDKCWCNYAHLYMYKHIHVICFLPCSTQLFKKESLTHKSHTHRMRRITFRGARNIDW